MVKIVEPCIEIITPLDAEYILKHLELCGRNCYKSEDNITDDSAKKMVAMLIKNGHESVLEHFSITVKITCDVGAYKDLTRHRAGTSFSIESTRYCNYSKGKFGSELTMMKPVNITDDKMYEIWFKTMEDIENAYNKMAAMGAKPDQMRMILPHSTKADVMMSANIRQWRHIFKMRASSKAHPSVYQVMRMLLAEFKEKLPVLFDDIIPE